MTLDEMLMQPALLPATEQLIRWGLLALLLVGVALIIISYVRSAPMSWLDGDNDSCPLDTEDKPPPNHL